MLSCEFPQFSNVLACVINLALTYSVTVKTRKTHGECTSGRFLTYCDLHL